MKSATATAIGTAMMTAIVAAMRVPNSSGQMYLTRPSPPGMASEDAVMAGQAFAIRNAATPARTVRMRMPAPEATAEKTRSPARMFAPPTGDGPGVSVRRLKRISSGGRRGAPGDGRPRARVRGSGYWPPPPTAAAAGSSWARSLSEIGAEPAAFAAASWPSGLTMYCMSPPTTLPWLASSYWVQAIW